MKEHVKNNIKNFFVILAISIAMSFVTPFIFGFYDDVQSDLFREVIISFIFTFSLYLANHTLLGYFNKRYPLFEQTKRRLLLSLGSMLVISSIIIFIIHISLCDFNINNVFNEGFKRSYRIAYTLIFLVSLVYESISFFKRWEHTIRSNESLKREVLKYELSMLKSQLSPHFFFNSLNSLIELIESDQDKAVEFVNQLSSIYRYVLEMRNQDLVHVTKEINLLKDYYSLLKIRFEDSVELNIEINEYGESKYIAPLTFQLLIENAIKHNIASHHQILEIKVREENKYWVVSNNVQPKLTASKNGIGLENLKKRYAKFSDFVVDVKETEHDFVVKIPILNVQ